jgi:hypothetical protein
MNNLVLCSHCNRPFRSAAPEWCDLLAEFIAKDGRFPFEEEEGDLVTGLRVRPNIAATGPQRIASSILFIAVWLSQLGFGILLITF